MRWCRGRGRRTWKVRSQKSEVRSQSERQGDDRKVIALFLFGHENTKTRKSINPIHLAGRSDPAAQVTRFDETDLIAARIGLQHPRDFFQLRLLECVELRVRDINVDRGELTVRDGKGGKDRTTMLPASVKRPLEDDLASVKAQHERDVAAGRGRVALPTALRLKYPNAALEWAWQRCFRLRVTMWTRRLASAAAIICTSPCCGGRSKRRRGRPAFRGRRVATRCDIRSRLTCWKRGTTSGRFRNSSVIAV